MATLSDAHIATLMADPKPIEIRQVNYLKFKRRPNGRGELVAKVSVRSHASRTFQITACEKPGPLAFSIILTFSWYGSPINLIRCNGHHRPHTNKIEDRAKVGVRAIPAKTWHIHYATHRYQLAGQEPEAYAEPTDGYFSCNGAIEFLCSHFGFYLANDDYGALHPLFRE